MEGALRHELISLLLVQAFVGAVAGVLHGGSGPSIESIHVARCIWMILIAFIYPAFLCRLDVLLLVWVIKRLIVDI